jgi:hypothetical protein
LEHHTTATGEGHQIGVVLKCHPNGLGRRAGIATEEPCAHHATYRHPTLATTTPYVVQMPTAAPPTRTIDKGDAAPRRAGRHRPTPLVPAGIRQTMTTPAAAAPVRTPRVRNLLGPAAPSRPSPQRPGSRSPDGRSADLRGSRALASGTWHRHVIDDGSHCPHAA